MQIRYAQTFLQPQFRWSKQYIPVATESNTSCNLQCLCTFIITTNIAIMETVYWINFPLLWPAVRIYCTKQIIIRFMCLYNYQYIKTRPQNLYLASKSNLCEGVSFWDPHLFLLAFWLMWICVHYLVNETIFVKICML